MYDLSRTMCRRTPTRSTNGCSRRGPSTATSGATSTPWRAFDDVAAALRDWERFSSLAGVRLDDLLELQGPSIIAMVPPRHRALRQVIRPAFFANQVTQLEPLVEQRR